jgi:flagellar hook-basal body complex protein FliE
MMNPISSIPTRLPAISGPLETARSDTASRPFVEFMLESLDQVNSMQQDADQAVESLMTGGDTNVAEVLTAVQKADMSFRMMLQTRNKLVQIYQELWNLRI